MRYRNIQRNALASYLNFSLSAILVLILSPIFVSALGVASFGIWKACLRILDFASAVDGRASQGLKWILASKNNESDPSKRQAVGSALKVWAHFLPITAVVLICLVWFMPYLIGAEDRAVEDVRIVAAILAINMVLLPLLGIPDAALAGANQAYISTNIQTLTLVISNLLMIWVAIQGFGLVGVVAVALFATLANAFMVYLAARRRLAWFGVAVPANRDEHKKAVHLSAWVLLWAFVSKFMLSIDYLLIAFFLGPDAVTKYVFNTYTTQLGLSVALITGSASAPAIASLLAAKDAKSATDLIDKANQSVFFVISVFASLTLLLNEQFISVWVGSQFYLGDGAIIAIVIAYIQLAFIRSNSQIQDASLNLRRKVLVGVVSSLLTAIFGVAVMVWSNGNIELLLCAIVLSRLGMLILYRRYVQDLRAREAKFPIRATVLLFYGLLCVFLSRRLEVSDFTTFALTAATGLLLSVLVAYMCCFSYENRLAIRAMVARRLSLD